MVGLGLFCFALLCFGGEEQERGKESGGQGVKGQLIPKKWEEWW